MRGEIGDVARMHHIVEACNEILQYTLESTIQEFETDSMMRFACIKQLEIIGEAANHVSDDTKSKFTNIEWRQIVGMRNVFVHEYFGIDHSLVWDIIQTDIPPLQSKVEQILLEL
ncbi:MAG: DUF86 domain-containing protein [Cyclobacteriaceae bacterium]